MTITQDDFKKVWASTSSVPQYTFSDTDYKNGWEFVGNLPPTRAMWDELQRKNDEKMQFLQENGSMCFDSVTDMKSSNLDAGQTAFTKGYYSINDGGAAVYIIRSKKESDTDDGGSVIFLDNNNVAELIIDGGINVKQFGAHGNGTDNDTVAFKKAISFASSNGNNILIPQGKYKVTTIEIPANVSLYGFGASIYSDSDIAFDIKSNTNADRSFIANINFYAKNPIVIEWGRKVTIKECSFHNVTGIGIYVKSGYEHDIRDCDFYGVGKNSIAIRMGTSDSRIDNCIIIDCYLGIKIDDNTNCYISNVHAWISSPSLLRGSVMFDCGNSRVFTSECYADTYHYVFSKKGYSNVTFNELLVSYNRDIWNQGMNADERPILTTASDLDVLVSVKMVECNLLWGMKVNDSNGNFTGYIDDSSIVKNGNEAKYNISYDTTLVEGTDSSKVIIRGGVMLINIACKLLKNTTSMQCIGTIPHPAAFNATVTFTGVVCATETSSPVGIAYMRIVNNKIYVLTNADYTGKILCASTTLYTCRPTWD